MKAQTMYTTIMATLVATVLTGIATLFDYPWTSSPELPAWQPMVLAIQDMWTAIIAKADAHRIVGETTHWYGAAIFFASAATCLITSIIAIAAGYRPRTTLGWVPCVIGLPLVGFIAASSATMWLPYLIDADQVLATAPQVDMSHLSPILVALNSFLMGCAQIAINGWNWWIWAALTTLMNLPLVAVMVVKTKREREEGVYMYILQA